MAGQQNPQISEEAVRSFSTKLEQFASSLSDQERVLLEGLVREAGGGGAEVAGYEAQSEPSGEDVQGYVYIAPNGRFGIHTTILGRTVSGSPPPPGSKILVQRKTFLGSVTSLQ